MTAPQPAPARPAWVSLAFLLRLAAVIAFIVAALVAFGEATVGNAFGICCVGLALLALSFIVP